MKTPIAIILILHALIGTSQHMLDEAVHLSHSGKFKNAELLFKKIETSSFDYTYDARLVRAYNYSWWGKHEKAMELFADLITEKNNIAAIEGLAYTYLFDGDIKHAQTKFNEALKLDPDRISLKKGLLLAAINAGQYARAKRHAKELSREEPLNPEYHSMIGQIAHANHRFSEAKRAFQTALQLDPKYQPALSYNHKTQKHFKKLVLGTWIGISEIENNFKIGIRRVDAFYQYNKKNLLYAFFDNALTFENFEFLVGDRNAPLIGLGNVRTWNDYLLTSLSYAQRFQSISENDHIIQLEQQVQLFPDLGLQLGYSYHDLSNEMNIHVYQIGLEDKLTEYLSIQVHYFHSQHADPGTKINRWMITPKLNFQSSLTINSSIYYTRSSSGENSDEEQTGIVSQIEFPISHQLTGKVLIQVQREPMHTSRNLALGLNYSL